MPAQLSPIRIGVVGCGRMAQVAHLPAIEKVSRFRLVGVCDPSATLSDAVARRYQVHGWRKASELFSDVDAVIIAVPDRFHVDLAIEALTAGKHVLLEKPIGTSSADADRLRGHVRDEVVFQVGSMKRHDPGIAYARTLLREGRLGGILSASVWYRVMASLRKPTETTLFPYVVVDPQVARIESEHKTAHRESHLLRTHGVHTFDLIQDLLGEYAVLSAGLAQVGDDHTWHGLGRLHDGGGLISFEVTASVHGDWSEGFEIYGDRGHLSLSIPFPFTKAASVVAFFNEQRRERLRPAFGKTNPYELQLESFAESIESRRPGFPGLADGLAALEALERVQGLAYESHGRRVPPAFPSHLEAPST